MKSASAVKSGAVRNLKSAPVDSVRSILAIWEPNPTISESAANA